MIRKSDMRTIDNSDELIHAYHVDVCITSVIIISFVNSSASVVETVIVVISPTRLLS